MDGNGRWATSLGKSRSEGHREGANAIDRLMDASLELGLKNISLYAFSTENWRRPITEIRSIFNLLVEFIDTRLDTIHARGIRIHHSGSRKRLTRNVLDKIDFAIERTKKNKNLNVNFCLNYGSKDELLRAAQEAFLRRKKEKSLFRKAFEKRRNSKNFYIRLPFLP